MVFELSYGSQNPTVERISIHLFRACTFNWLLSVEKSEPLKLSCPFRCRDPLNALLVRATPYTFLKSSDLDENSGYSFHQASVGLRQLA